MFTDISVVQETELGYKQMTLFTVHEIVLKQDMSSPYLIKYSIYRWQMCEFNLQRASLDVLNSLGHVSSNDLWER